MEAEVAGEEGTLREEWCRLSLNQPDHPGRGLLIAGEGDIACQSSMAEQAAGLGFSSGELFQSPHPNLCSGERHGEGKYTSR